MTDVHSPAIRSKNMAAIKGKDTKPEMKIRKMLHAAGFRYRLHVKDLPGKPDLVLPKYKAVIFVHGCFWHMHDCDQFKLPKSNQEFWINKLSRNKKNDELHQTALISAGWRVCTIWECSLKGPAKLSDNQIYNTIVDWLYAASNEVNISGKCK
ncbi:DNA mismatch endonuclease Vsr [Pseudochrobactrum sp. XF203]|nr:DNA mismatch endonuclease Vsr [Pseudochrobactrum sp. XF203]UCA46999.1 DNA mismatch endonuclease Vsr [Pseudochrobactrum sp. XF203]